jgi:hypothetical protein
LGTSSTPTKPRTSGLTPQFRYSERAARYIDRGGRFVSPRTVRAAVDEVLEAARMRIPALTQRLTNGVISIGEWQGEMAKAIKIVHMASASAGRGGWAQMTGKDWERVSSSIKEQYGYLQRFAGQVERGELTEGQITARAEQYAEMGRKSYEATRREVGIERGMDEERNLLAEGDNCDDCLEETAKGWTYIGLLSLPGERQCHGNCHCEIEQGNSKQRGTGEED